MHKLMQHFFLLFISDRNDNYKKLNVHIGGQGREEVHTDLRKCNSPYKKIAHYLPILSICAPIPSGDEEYWLNIFIIFKQYGIYNLKKILPISYCFIYLFLKFQITLNIIYHKDTVFFV